MSRVFGKNSRRIAGELLLGVMLLTLLGAGAAWYYATPKYTRVGYAPLQPIAYSHKLHVSQLGLDCLYCHNNVRSSPHANIPAQSTCWNCHGTDKGNIKSDSLLLAPLREAQQSGGAIHWVRVHQLPDFVYFNHQIHVNRGVSCVSCHGRVDEMEVVRQVQPMSMSWCLDCHRNPDASLRLADQVTNLAWQVPDDAAEFGKQLRESAGIRPPTNCTGCHR